MKATYVELDETVSDSGIGETGVMDNQITVGRNIFKDPITDDGTKKSATGLLSVQYATATNDPSGSEFIILHDKCNWDEEMGGLLQSIYLNGTFINTTTLTNIRARLAK